MVHFLNPREDPKLNHSLACQSEPYARQAFIGRNVCNCESGDAEEAKK